MFQDYSTLFTSYVAFLIMKQLKLKGRLYENGMIPKLETMLFEAML